MSYEFFAGVGMARMGLGGGWQCLFANDCDDLKCKAYADNWAGEHFDNRDIALISAAELAGLADLAWASPYCQHLTQAGSKKGIGYSGSVAATRSGAVWPFLDIVKSLAEEGRHPTVLALENVVGLLNANGGADFRALCTALSKIGYRYGALVVNTSHFVPQSRPRVFVIAVRREVPVPHALCTEQPHSPWHAPTLLRASAALTACNANDWIWWAPGSPPEAKERELTDVVELGDDAEWNSDAATDRLIGMMSETQLERLAAAKAAGRPMIGSLYLRMRPSGDDASGNVQRCEIAFGDTLGCLRTPKGGASRPRIIVVDGESVRTRLLSVQEAALLMGLNEDFNLPDTYHECFRLIGDGVVPAVVRFLADRILEPLRATARYLSALVRSAKPPHDIVRAAVCKVSSDAARLGAFLTGALLRADEGNADPIRSFEITPERLAFFCGQSSEHAAEAESALRRALIADPYLTWCLQHGTFRTAGTEAPECMAILALTLLVDSLLDGESSGTNEYRTKLRQWLGIDRSFTVLRGIAIMWEELVAWLDFRVAEGAPFRRLILPEIPKTWTHIGYTRYLSFPTRRDLRFLEKQIRRSPRLVNDPAYLVRILDPEIGASSVSFGLKTAFADFQDGAAIRSGLGGSPILGSCRAGALRSRSAGSAAVRT